MKGLSDTQKSGGHPVKRRDWPMKKGVFLTLVSWAALLGTGCADGMLSWERDYGKGMLRARQQGRRALVQFYTALDKECIDMDLEVFSDKDVKTALQDFVLIRLDGVVNKDLAQRFNVQTVPTFYMIRSDGRTVATHAGKMDAREFSFFLIKYRYN